MNKEQLIQEAVKQSELLMRKHYGNDVIKEWVLERTEEEGDEIVVYSYVEMRGGGYKGSRFSWTEDCLVDARLERLKGQLKLSIEEYEWVLERDPNFYLIADPFSIVTGKQPNNPQSN